MKKIFFWLIVWALAGCSTIQEKDNKIRRNNRWVFILAGQSNMAGRGVVEPQDTITDETIYTLNNNLLLELAKEPLHFYEPGLAGVGPGFAFARELKQHIPDSIEIILVPCAVGGSSINQWIGDSLHRGVHLYSNFETRLDTAKKIGTVKAILWLQGESDANPSNLPSYQNKLENLFQRFRSDAENNALPIFVGELGTYAEPELRNQNWQSLNKILSELSVKDNNLYVISSEGLASNPDHIHFNSESQRALGKRYARKYLENIFEKK